MLPVSMNDEKVVPTFVQILLRVLIIVDAISTQKDVYGAVKD